MNCNGWHLPLAKSYRWDPENPLTPPKCQWKIQKEERDNQKNAINILFFCRKYFQKNRQENNLDHLFILLIKTFT